MPARRPVLVLINKKKKTSNKKRPYNLIEIKKSKKKKQKKKYLELAREVKMLQNVRITVIPIVVGALGTVVKDRRNWKSVKESRPSH